MYILIRVLITDEEEVSCCFDHFPQAREILETIGGGYWSNVWECIVGRAPRMVAHWDGERLTLE